ncbi:MAG: methylated-DNA--[protein]-cysteine S-methyltransferase [Bacteroidia bacterium]|nr:methylated-DNA--[protein]-cysteine S-methyltransferase [Bacteroidia bacterium]
MNSKPITKAKNPCSSSPTNHPAFQKPEGSGGSENRIVIKRIASPLGSLWAGASNCGLCLLEFPEKNGVEAELNDLRKQCSATVVYGTNSILEQTEKELGEYFTGIRKSFDVSLHFPGSLFRRKVWQSLLEIPYGQTISYSRQAKKMNLEGAVRAVAHANGMNRIAILIPCHRVIGENGSLTGYGGGLYRKQWLLNHERKHSGGPVQGTLFH